MNAVIVLVGSTAIVVLTLALAREIRLRQALQRLLARLLSLWRNPHPAAKRTLSDRVNGDLVAALIRARELDERIETFKSAGQGKRSLSHVDLVEAYRADLNQRAEACEIDPRTVSRYRSALKHYLKFSEQPAISSKFKFVAAIDRHFALQFASYLSKAQVSSNGHENTKRRRMTAPQYVESVVRSMLVWAADPEQGNLLPHGFRNPFSGRSRKTNQSAADPLSEPAISMEMAVEFLKNCDDFQRPLFALLAFYGLRASEPCYLFCEYVDDGWLRIPCNPGIAYMTKGRRDKRLPLLPPLEKLLTRTSGILLARRAVVEGRDEPPLLGHSVDELQRVFEERCQARAELSAHDRVRVRDQILKEAGAMQYDHIEHEFGRVAKKLHWPSDATLKGFRHLFASAMENAGVPEFYRRYLMGHAPDRAAITTYTHLNELRTQYERAVELTLRPLTDVVTAGLAVS